MCRMHKCRGDRDIKERPYRRRYKLQTLSFKLKTPACREFFLQVSLAFLINTVVQSVTVDNHDKTTSYTLLMNYSIEQSPRITSISWGKMKVEELGGGKDFKLWPGGGREWDWTETNTHHTPGIQVDDIRELIEEGAKEIILSRGMMLALKTCKETKSFLKDEGIPFHILETKKAAALYNKLIDDGIAVGGLFHSTC